MRIASISLTGLLCFWHGGEATAAEVAGKHSSLVTSASSIPCRLAATKLSTMDALLVDVRGTRATRDAWVPGALHVPLAFVPRNTLIRSSRRTVVLMGDGKDTAMLERQCGEWRSIGLSHLRVVAGGLPAFRRAGGRVSGDAGSLEQPLRVDDSELHAILHEASQNVALVFAEVRPTESFRSIGARVVEATKARRSPDTLLGKVPFSTTDTVVIFVGSLREAASWRSAAGRRNLPDPLFYVGDPTAYGVYADRTRSILDNVNRRVDVMCELE